MAKFVARGASASLLTLLLAFLSPSSADVHAYLEDFTREQAALESSESKFLVGHVPQPERASTELVIRQIKDTPSDVYRLYGRIFVPEGVLPEIVKFAREYDKHAGFYATIRQSKTCRGTPDSGITFRYWTTPGRPTVTESIAHHRWVDANRYAISSIMTGTGSPQRGSAGKGSEELFGSEPNYSAILSPSPEMNQVEISIRTIAQIRDRNT